MLSSFRNHLDNVWFSDQLSRTCLMSSRVPYPSILYLRLRSVFIFSDKNYFSWRFIVFLLHSTKPYLLSCKLPFTNPSSTSNIILKTSVHPISLSYRFAHHNIVSNLIASYGIAPNGNIISNSIKPNSNIVSHNIVDNCTLLLSKGMYYSIPSAYIRHVNGIDFTIHSRLYFDVQCWIVLLLPLHQLFVLSIQLEYFMISSRNDSPSCRSIQFFLLCW